MDMARLAALIQQPEIHKRILGNYVGAYSLGVALDYGKQAVIRVRVEREDTLPIARQIVLDGQTVPVLVSVHFTAPQPL